MRLFVALTAPAEVVAHAESAIAPLREGHPDLRWIPADRWHLTLAFYGEVPDDKVAGTERMITGRVAGRPPLHLRFRGAGSFARRALWLGVDGDVVGLKALARAVTFERRPYRPHLTVARLRGTVDAGPAVEALAAYDGPTWIADRVHLVRSHLGPRPTYDDVTTWPLTAQP
jgi:2'-5' RNA ligase